jgi:GT2 family glycosyltransferase
VRPQGDPAVVPSTIDDPVAREYSREVEFVLYTQSMALHRTVLLEFGGFDGRIQPAAEDNDLSYRWLRAGMRIRYEPDFVVWHHDWRSPEQLDRLYVNYGIGQGMVYGKHLRHGDLVVARYLAGAVATGLRGLLARMIRGPRRSHGDPRLGLLRGLPVGLVRGWRAGREGP